MAEMALIAGLASAGSAIYGGYSKMREGNTANKIAGVNAANLRQQGDETYNIALYNAASARAAGEFDAKQLEQQALLDRAAGYASADERRTQTNQVLSRERAVAAAGGAGGVGTAGVMDIMGDTFKRGQYLADLEKTGGEAKATGDVNQAASARARAINAAYGIELEGASARDRAYSGANVDLMQGDAARKAGYNAMIGSILQGAGTAGGAYYKYGYGKGTGGYDPNGDPYR